MSLYSLGVPAAIPADAVELLRKFVTTPGTLEKTLEDWVRQFPQVVGAASENLWPHVRIRFPGEPEKLWEPDILYRETQAGYFDLIELKRADRSIVVAGREGTVWLPSSPPKFASYAASAISQLQIYLIHAQEHREFLEKAHSLKILVPRGLVIAGQETDLAVSRDLRLLRRGLPNDVQFVTWTAILQRAEQLKAHRMTISFPCVAPGVESTNSFDCGFHRNVTSAFHPWTGFSSPYSDPLHAWESLFNQADQKIAEYASQNDIDENDESWTEFKRFEGQVLAPIYYRLGKYCLDDNQFKELWRVLPGKDRYVNRRSFEKFYSRMLVGFADTQIFLNTGAAAKSIAKLEAHIARVIEERRFRRISNGLQEPESFYRRIMTYGFLKENLLGSDLSAVLRVGGWIDR